MKKSLLIAATALIGASVFAQTTVTSANIVGYVKINTTNGLKIVAQQFDSTNATPETLFGDSLPAGSTIYAYDPVDGYVGHIATYAEVFLSGLAWTPANLDLSSGSFWVESTGITTNIFSGDVNMATNTTINLVPGLNLVKYPYPVEVSISDLDITPSEGDVIYKFDPETGYIGNIATYAEVFLSGLAWNTDLTFEVGEGFWYQNSTDSTNVWVEARPF